MPRRRKVELISPGTVSKILWHFTRGPRWNPETNSQDKKKKSPKIAFDSLIKIIGSRKLKVGNYKEIVKVTARTARVRDGDTGKINTYYNYPVILKGREVCCLADIPIGHLNYHAERYGKFAIGFHRSSAILAGFHPVFYQLHNSPVLQAIQQGFAYLELAEECDIEVHVAEIREKLEENEWENPSEENVVGEFINVEAISNVVGHGIVEANNSLREILAFVKTFDEGDFSSIYCEREWRSTIAFDFDFDDVAMIVLPKEGGYFEKYAQMAQAILPRTIPIVAWEDLIEH